MTTKRPIQAMSLPDVVPGAPPTPVPVVINVRPHELLVDPEYQRDLSERGLRLVRKIVAEWDWRKYHAPIVAMTDEVPMVLDGQHTAIAAASHPCIHDIPVLLVEAPEQRDQASSFVALNRDRIGITTAQMHAAAVVAGDPAALAIERVCERAGVRVVNVQPGNGLKPRDTMAVGAIGAMIGRAGGARGSGSADPGECRARSDQRQSDQGGRAAFDQSRVCGPG